MVPQGPPAFNPAEQKWDGGNELQGGTPARVLRAAGLVVLVRPSVRGPAACGRAPAVHRGPDKAARSVRTSRGGRDLASPRRRWVRGERGVSGSDLRRGRSAGRNRGSPAAIDAR